MCRSPQGHHVDHPGGAYIHDRDAFHHPSLGHTLIKVLTPSHVAPPDTSLQGADTGFSVGGGVNLRGGANIQICWIFPKTA